MPHFKCVGCRTRLYSAAAAADPVGELCPECGSPLEPVGELAEIVGFQSIRQRDSAADDGPARRHQRTGDRIDLLPLRAAIRSRARLDRGRRADGGGSFSPDAVAQAIALPPPREHP
jgi:hypothetical protein